MNDDSKVLNLESARAADLTLTGGKAVGLHRLFALKLPVPAGFVVTTHSFTEALAADAELRRITTAIDLTPSAETEKLRTLAAEARKRVLAQPLSETLTRALVDAWTSVTGRAAVAVRSSATAEDLADASFAGQQDSFLNVIGERALAEAVLKCWASLFTERAVVYRRRHDIGSASLSIAVVVQRMVKADAAGVVFTADPLTGRRDVTVIEAVAGLGEALVSGQTIPERLIVIGKKVTERIGVDGRPMANQSALLTDAQATFLAHLGATTAAHAAQPMDLEWTIENGQLWLVQARPITTLWPVPEGVASQGWRTYVSFGHLQVNTDALSRIGSSMLRRLVPLSHDVKTGVSSLLALSGERIYVDATPMLARWPFGRLLPKMVQSGSPAIAARLEAIADREELRAFPASERVSVWGGLRILATVLLRAISVLWGEPEAERRRYVAGIEEFIASQEKSLNATDSVLGQLDAVLLQFRTMGTRLLFHLAFPRVFPALALEKLLTPLVSKLVPAADAQVLFQGLEGNITTEMDLQLADLADAARGVPPLVEALKSQVPVEAVMGLQTNPTFEPFFDLWTQFVERHGHRSAGEIDPAVPRWSEDPRVPFQSVVGALGHAPRELRQRHTALRKNAEALQKKLVAAASTRRLGFLFAPALTGLLKRLRMLHGVREHHKFAIVKTIALVRKVTLRAGAILVDSKILRHIDDVWLLELDELRATLADLERGESVSLVTLIEARRASWSRFKTLSPPAVITSTGEVIRVAPRGDAPVDTLVGTAVSSGQYEGIARVVYDPGTDRLEPGEVLVARFTDPGWTPLFGHAGALVMEVGGQMTHGSVIARELGIPAVVAVEGATSSIQTGTKVRVDGDRGWVTVCK